MKLKVKVKFHDLKEDQIREIGDEFIVSKQRGEELLSHALNLVEEVKETKKK